MTSFTIPLVALRTIHDAIAHYAGDKTIPQLQTITLDVADGSVQAWITDRYRIGWIEHPLSSTDVAQPGRMWIGVQQLRKALAAFKDEETPSVLATDQALACGDVTIRLPETDPDTIPPVERLLRDGVGRAIDARKTNEHTPYTALNLTYLADTAKTSKAIHGRSTSSPGIITMPSDPSKPIVILIGFDQEAGTYPRAAVMQMPMRAPGEGEAVGEALVELQASLSVDRVASTA